MDQSDTYFAGHHLGFVVINVLTFVIDCKVVMLICYNNLAVYQ
jgi:hypothetical protein